MMRVLRLKKNKSKRPAGFDIGNLPESFVDDRVDVISKACYAFATAKFKKKNQA